MKRSSFITWDQLKVGGMILVALRHARASPIYKLGQAANLFSKRYRARCATCRTRTGLRVGGPVFVAGQFAGTIKAIEFLPVDNDTTRNLRVAVEVDAGTAAADARATRRRKCARSASSATRSSTSRSGTPRYRGPARGRHDRRRAVARLRGGARAGGGRGRRHGRAHARPAAAHRRHRPRRRARSDSSLTNRALYDQFVGTMAPHERARARASRIRNGSLGRLLERSDAVRQSESA